MKTPKANDKAEAAPKPKRTVGTVAVRASALPCWCEADCFEDETVCYCGCHAIPKRRAKVS